MSSPHNILLISPVGTHPTISGNAIRPIYLAKQLAKLGYTPHLAFTDFGSGDIGEMRRYWGGDRFHYFPFRAGHPRWALKRLVRRVGLANTRMSHWWRSRTSRQVDPQRKRPRLDEYYDEAMSAWLASLQARHQFDAVIAHFVILSRALEAFPAEMPRILDTQEVFAVGREEAAARGERYWIDLTPEDEIAGLRRADYVWAVQNHDEAVLRAHLDGRVLTVGLFVDPLPVVPRSAIQSKNILFVGGNQRANAEGLKWFGTEVFPKLRSWLSPENVVIVGKVKDAIGSTLPFRFVGPVRDLGPFYADARIAFSPILTGTGLKSKNVEAYAYAKPLVTTAFGRLGLETADGCAHLVANDAAAFASAIQLLMRDDVLCGNMMVGALAYAHRWNDQLCDSMRRCLELPSAGLKEK